MGPCSNRKREVFLMFSRARMAVLSSHGVFRRPSPALAKMLSVVAQSARPEPKRSTSCFPEVVVPGMGVAQVVLRTWLRVERHVSAVVGANHMEVDYFRLQLHGGAFWCYCRGGENKIPASAVVVY